MAIISAVFQNNIFQDNAFQDNEWGGFVFQADVFQRNVFDTQQQITKILNETEAVTDGLTNLVGIIRALKE